MLASCSSDDPAEVAGPVDEDIAAGIEELEDELFSMINSSNIESPRDMDFSAAKAHFATAVRKDPTNMDGHFGLSLTTILALTSDEEINAAFDEWEAYLEDNTPFREPGKSADPLGVPLTFLSGSRNLEMPLDIMAHSLVLGVQPSLKAVEPSIARVQDIFRDRVIPALESAASHLGTVAGDPSYVFWVTPMMLGDAEEDSLELDRTEVLAARAGVLLLSSVCRLAVAYDLSFPSFDAAGIVSGLDREEGNLLRLREDGAFQMNNVETDFLGAVDAFDLGITSLLNETDQQDDDIIKIGPDDVSRNELVDIQVNNLPDVRALFADGLVVTEDWDGRYQTPDVDLRIFAHNFLADPVEDWKMMLPPFTVSVGTEHEGYMPYDYTEWGSVSSSTSGHASAGAMVWVEGNQAVRDSTWGHAEVAQEALELCQWRVDELYWYGYQYQGTIRATFEGNLNVGYNTIYLYVDFELVSNAPVNVYPHITWEADTFVEWKNGWGNYNLNGLLPEIQSTDHLFMVFGITADDWRKEFDIDWTDLD